ncbi:ABC transporter permease [Thalassotalea marina]|uniref:ABC transporter permease n=1 Tax=Thalassotalea marina TaxID=1673741 RepID=A0A919ELS4_9GAMM|nr:FtsX-like permease family protein [Thalassotalea marina]GHF92699.1 ABC transporter permease [Thalassotalea marina]
MNFKALLKSLMLRKFAVGLLVIQLALTLGLIVNSSILALDTIKKLEEPMGIDIDNILIVDLVATSGAYRDDDYANAITLEDMAKIEALPGVIAATPSIQLPIQSGGTNGNMHDIDNPDIELTNKYLSYVPFFFATEKIQQVFDLELIEGRLLSSSDMFKDGDEKMNIVITQSLKHDLYGEDSAIGRETNNGIIVGVVKDFNISPLKPDDKQYAVFKPYIIPNSYHYLVKVEPGQFNTIKNQISDVILSVQPERDIRRVYSMADHLEKFYQQDQGLANLFIMLCVLMVLVTIISSYANAQFHVSKQRKIIGIRRALGARKKDVLIYVLAENWLVCLMGSFFGILAIMGINIMLSNHLEIAKPEILPTIIAICVLAVIGTLATWLPAIKTSNIPPVIATKTV